MVTDTTSHHLVNRENVEKEGKFAFTTDKYDVFEICFICLLSFFASSGCYFFFQAKPSVGAACPDELGASPLV